MPNAEDVKELRDRTGAGILDCKEALSETSGMEHAVEYLQKKDAEMADEISGRTAAEGVVALWENDDSTQVILAEVNCETDFTARSEGFQEFAEAVVQTAAEIDAESIEELQGENLVEYDVGTLGGAEKSLTAEFGENVQARRLENMGPRSRCIVGTYLHSDNSIGSAVVVEVGEDTDPSEAREFAKNMAMQVASMNPTFLAPEDAPEDLLEKKREVFEERMKEKGKPEHIIPKIVDGKIDKWKNENALLRQPYVRDEDRTVGEMEDETDGVEIVNFCRLEVGEGVETEEENFAEEVRELSDTT